MSCEKSGDALEKANARLPAFIVLAAFGRMLALRGAIKTRALAPRKLAANPRRDAVLASAA